MSRKPPVYYNVAPRYTGGSPAQVDQFVALNVAREEREAYDRVIEGFHGLDEKVKAEQIGLAGIVEEREERADCWIVLDLLTGAKFVRLFPFHEEGDEKRRQRRAFRLGRKYHLPVEPEKKS